MKKKILMVFLLALTLVLSACGKNTQNTTKDNQVGTTTKFVPQTEPPIDEDEIQNDKVKVKETLDSLTIENAFVSASFNLDNGSLYSLLNKKSEVDYLENSTGGAWAMTVDTSTGDPFRTNYQGENAVNVSSRKQTSLEYNVDKTNDNAVVTFTYDVSFTSNGKKYQGITVTEIVTLLKGTQELVFSYEINNQSTDEITICNFTGAQLSGLKDSKNGKLKLFWPNKEGKIYDDAIDKIKNTSTTKENLVNVYPGLCSMQLIQLYNNKESLYVFVKDDTREYKIANYGNFNTQNGYDFGEVSEENKISLSFTQFPFVGSGETKKTFDTVIGVSVNESWYKGSDRYQEFLYEKNMINDYSSFPENWNGFIALVGSQYGSKHFSSYVASGVGEISYADWVKQADDNSGVDTTLVLGWNQNGFDSMYPDYDFATGEGFNGEEGFREMTTAVHENGDLVCNHMNSRIADMESNWSNEVKDQDKNLTNLQLSGVKRAGFNENMSSDEYEDYLVCESYSTGTLYYVMSSASKEFQDQVLSVVRRLRDAGSNGLWYDQLFERDGYLDYDKRHIMSEKSTPATLYAEGYMYILSEIENISKTINPLEPWVLVAGGQGGDAFAKWIGVYGGNWNRKLGATDNSADNTIDQSGTENCDRHLMSPELIEYTVPAKYIGQAGAGTLSGQTDEYARAFVFASPFLAEQFTTSTMGLITVYDFYPDIFYNGKYTDMKGLQVSDSDVIASVVLSKTQNRFAVQLYNYDKNPSKNLTIYISLSRLGINGEITKATSAFNGDEFSVKDNVITLNLDANEFTSIIVEYTTKD